MVQSESEFRKIYAAGENATGATTTFFRYPALMEKFADYILSKPRGSVSSVLFAPCSVGCEPLTFAMVAKQKGVFEAHPDLQIHGLDISEKLLDLARDGTYPYEYFNYMPKEYASFMAEPDRFKDFVTANRHVSALGKNRMFSVTEDILSRVRFLPAQDIREHKVGRPYDMSVCLNLFYHLPRSECVKAFNNLADMTRGLICIEDFDKVYKTQVRIHMKDNERRFLALSDDFKTATDVRPNLTAEAFRSLYKRTPEALSNRAAVPVMVAEIL